MKKHDRGVTHIYPVMLEGLGVGVSRAGFLISSLSSADHWKVVGRGFVFSSDTFLVANTECATLIPL